MLFVTAAYVRATPVRASRAAIRRTVPGRAGQFLGMDAAFVFRFLPVLQDDVAQSGRPRRRVSAPSARSPNGCDSSWRGAQQAFERADTFALALRARCFAWNPMLPELRPSYRDVPALLLAAGLLGVAVHGAV